MKNIIYHNLLAIYLPPKSNSWKEAFAYLFPNSVIYTTEKMDHMDIRKSIKQNDFKGIILVDYLKEYSEIMRDNPDTPIFFVYTKTLASLTDLIIREGLYEIIRGLEQQQIKKVAFTDESLYRVLQQKYSNVTNFSLTLPITNKRVKKGNKTVGILVDETDFKSNFYNQLSALSFFKGWTVKTEKPSKRTTKFTTSFNISLKPCSNLEETMEENEINLNIAFTNTDMLPFLRSMDMQIPCLLGNTNLLDIDPFLKKMLVLDSDDNIDEIKTKMNEVLQKKEEIFKHYQEFRKQYDIECFNRKEKFYKEKKIEPEESTLLCSVVVPIYNVETYLKECVESIIKAIQKTTQEDDFEVLLINDGSTDQSATIAKKFQKKYPTLITYLEQENHGLGAVRNVGLKQAKGKYIASIDSDDIIDERFFVDALPSMNKGIDLIIYDWDSILINENKHFVTMAIEDIYKGESRYKKLLYTTIMPSACNKIIKKSLFTTNQLTFIEGKRYEDLSTIPIIFLNSKTVDYQNKPYYGYKIRSQSIMRSKLNLDMVDVLNMLDERLEKTELTEQEKQEFRFYVYFWRIEQYVIAPLYQEDIDQKKACEFIQKNFSSVYQKVYQTNFMMKEYLAKHPDLKQALDKRTKAIQHDKLEQYIKETKESPLELTAAKLYLEK